VGHKNPQLGAGTPQLEVGTPQLGVETIQLGMGTQGAEGQGISLNDKYGPLIAGVFSKLDSSTASRIDKIRASGRSKASEVKSVILILCSIHPLTTLQLSIILNRSSSLMTYYLTPLVNSGQLKYYIPEINFPPRKAYITNNKASSH
jgi:hypothetical protein